MKKPKTAIILISLVISLSIFFFFFPLKDISKNIPILKGFYRNTNLEITTPNGKALVEIDNKDYGNTPSNITNLVAGKYEVKLTRESDTEDFYKTHIFNIELTKNSTSRINMEIGPDDTLHGFLLYYTQENTVEKGNGKLTLTSSNDGTKVYINKEYKDTTPITNLSLPKGEYNIKVVTQDFEDLEFPIILVEGHILNVKVYQFPIPITFELEQENE